jgi:hypothetical protein
MSKTAVKYIDKQIRHGAKPANKWSKFQFGF